MATCPSCKQPFDLAANRVGQRVTCPHCQKAFTVKPKARPKPPPIPAPPPQKQDSKPDESLDDFLANLNTPNDEAPTAGRLRRGIAPPPNPLANPATPAKTRQAKRRTSIWHTVLTPLVIVASPIIYVFRWWHARHSRGFTTSNPRRLKSWLTAALWWGPVILVSACLNGVHLSILKPLHQFIGTTFGSTIVDDIYLSIANPLFQYRHAFAFFWLCWLFAGWKLARYPARYLTGILINQIRCHACGDTFSVVGQWDCSCGYHDRHDSNILVRACPHCRAPCGEINCLRCGQTLLL